MDRWALVFKAPKKGGVALGLALGAFALGGCVGEDPGQPPITGGDPNGAEVGPPNVAGDGGTEPNADGGSGGNSDGGSADAREASAPLPLIDQYSVSTTGWPGTKAECVDKIDASINALGGGYALAAGTSSFGRYAIRPGAVVVASCSDDAAKVVTQVWAIKTAANASNDETRLKNLVFDTAAPAVSPAATSFPTIRSAERIVKVPGLALSTCQNRAKSAIDALSSKAPPSPSKWSKLGGDFMAIGGTEGTTTSITCLGDMNGTVLLDAFTIDAAVTTSALIEALDDAFAAAG